ncbi:arabinofuranosyltransferase [Virgisporangium ochraceum]|uniref:Galactan 5-O-arabinofuranosyltransferase n=1 Tax=Virgisporangium ochraceum TaxID=65505 RepID=A0A8J4A2N2_9ACTN|nr:arabinofuranosyltransferase [Virgisporangium ochraceum]GIJ72260.1 arabinofuranosyltransferase AftA [Virgisporangium ochraceum]
MSTTHSAVTGGTDGRDRDDAPDADRPTAENLTTEPPAPEQPAAEESTPAEAVDPSPATARWRRPVTLLAAVAAGAALAWVVGSVDTSVTRYGSLARYELRTFQLVLVLVTALAVVRAVRRDARWDADVVVAAVAALSAATVTSALRGTPYGLAGLWDSDQSFRMQAVTRFADTWHSADYFYKGLHAYYAPLFPWLEGRAAALFDVPAWHMVKVGEIVGAFVAPLLAYWLWKRIVSDRVAAFMAVATLTTGIVVYEPYALVVMVTVVPWWVQAFHGVRRADARPLHPVVLGLVGALMFTTYYYYLFVCVVVAAILVPVELRYGRLTWVRVRRAAVVLGVTFVGSAPFWAPLVYDILTAADYRPMNNRWFQSDFADLPLPMFQPTVLGAVCLLGLVYLVWTAREELSRSLLVFLAGLYVWHAAGYLMIMIDVPLLSFKMRDLVPLVLVCAAVLAVHRLAAWARRRFDRVRVQRLTAVLVAGLCLLAADRYVGAILDSDLTPAAHDTPLPDGTMPRHATGTPDAERRLPPAEDLRRAIEERYRGSGHPVVLSDRQDLYVFYPYYGYVEYSFAYSHPTAQFRGRVAVLEWLQSVPWPDQFANAMVNNPYDRIDVIVLQRREGCLRFRFHDENWPNAYAVRELCLPAAAIDDTYFDSTTVGDYVVAVRRT